MNILILGAGPGLSRSVAEKFGKNGFEVILVSRNEEKLITELAELQSQKIPACYFKGDVSQKDFLADIITKVIHQSGLPDIILYNAFVNKSGGFEDETWESLCQEQDINVGGAFNLLKYVMPLYRKEGKGNLFFTGGCLGISPSPEYLGIGLGKAALRNLVQAASEVMKDTDVHVATVTVTGIIGGDDPKFAPSLIAEKYWELYQQDKPKFQTEIIY